MADPMIRLATDLEPWDRFLDPASARYMRDTLRLPNLSEAARKWKRGRKWTSRRAAMVTTTGDTVLMVCALATRTKIVCAGFVGALDGPAGEGVGIDVAALTELHAYSIVLAPPGLIPDAVGAEAGGHRPLIVIDHGRAGQVLTNGPTERRFDVLLGVGEVRHEFTIGPHVLH